MILSKEFYDQCCPKYQKVIDELERKIAVLKALDNDDGLEDGEISEFSYEIKAEILNFAKIYLTPKEYWDHCITTQYILHEDEKQRFEVDAFRYKHFYFGSSYHLKGDDDDLEFRLLDFVYEDAFDYENYYADELDISYPHNYLTNCFSYFESHTLRLPSINVVKRYEKMKLLYPKIKATENDVDAWFKLLLQTEDETFVRDNVEHRLGKNLFDVKLWMLYIKYLKQKGFFEDLLRVYSNYCRFFLEDFDMFEKYKSETIKYGPVDLHWSYLFDFEHGKNYEDCEMQNCEDCEMQNCEDCEKEEVNLMDGEYESVEEESMDTEDESINSDEDFSMDEDDESQNSEVLPLDKELFQNFYDTYKFQIFPFKGPLMSYIIQNANHRVLRSLFKSCKYFFYKKSTPICYRLDTRHSPEFDSESLTLSYSCNPDLYVKNTFITGSIDVSITGEHRKNFISRLIPRLSRCEAKYIDLSMQKLTFNEFKFLASHGQVVCYTMFRGCIKEDNNEDVDLEKIMVYLLNIEKLCLPKVKCNSNTAHALSNQSFNRKIHCFDISSLSGEPFDPNEFLKFCLKNRDEDILLRMFFDKDFDAVFVKKFKEIMTDYQESCKLTEIDVGYRKPNPFSF